MLLDFFDLADSASKNKLIRAKTNFLLHILTTKTRKVRKVEKSRKKSNNSEKSQAGVKLGGFSGVSEKSHPTQQKKVSASKINSQGLN